MSKPILEHEGRKYLKTIHSAVDGSTIQIDVYSVIEAFGIACPGRQQALKKLLMAGGRNKGTILDDLIGADAALSRAIDLQRNREKRWEEKNKEEGNGKD